MLTLPSMKPVENSNLWDWSCIRRTNGQIRLKEKRSICVESVWEKLSSVDPISLARVQRGSYFLTSGKLKGSGKCRKVKVMKKRRKRSRESGRTTTQHVMTMEMTMRRKHHDLSLEPVCDVQEMSVTTQNWLRRIQHHAHAHVFMLCFVLTLWILVFTLSPVSDASTSSKMVLFVNCMSPRIRNTKCKVLSFWML